ncbi:MAG: enoyl-CoA hydratase/isomerase family protein [Deltaproteobacteria bacterium]|jgi:enoyl-CoA hydratase/carnithine racemase|nr:enoyl-CoA hydratase/isomerase family protein [Deltaproteobacteria bacterium]
MNEIILRPESEVLIRRQQRMMSIVLNRPRALNSLNLEMIRSIKQILDEIEADERCRFILFYGAGEKGFCAGGDVKALARAIQQKSALSADLILKQEYDMLLRLHRFPKPVIVLADGITMGAGLGLAASADMAVATDRTRMAMPETRIGFFPDVGSTGWMFDKCPAGYPEYLGLTGYEMKGAETVRVGFATHLTSSDQLPELIKILEGYEENLPSSRIQAAKHLASTLDPFFKMDITANTDMDQWVATYFKGKSSLMDIIKSLRQCSIQTHLCDQVFERLAERSPTALVVTLKLLRHNQHRLLEDVFQAELSAARFILNHPDYVEGVRARLVDKDDHPLWQPDKIEAVGDLDLKL